MWNKCLDSFQSNKHNILHTCTSTCIFRCVLNEESKERKMERDSSKTWGILDTPFLLRATQRYCLTADIKTSSVRNTGPEFCRMDKRSSRERILERSSWDLCVCVCVCVCARMCVYESLCRHMMRVCAGIWLCGQWSKTLIHYIKFTKGKWFGNQTEGVHVSCWLKEHHFLTIIGNKSNTGNGYPINTDWLNRGNDLTLSPVKTIH